MPVVREAIKLKKEAFWVLLSQESPEAADRYRLAKGAATLVVAKAKTGVERIW